jgi:tetratricopeptide (TPR) repeat protein
VNAQGGRIVATRELFRSDELLVRQVTGFGGPLCYVTFDSYTNQRTLDRAGFGEDYFRGRAIDAIHVLSRENRWYQHLELDEALAAVAAAASGYERVIAYGSSMGGFAALHHGAACGASVGLALSPQFSVDPEIVPFDRRWADDVARIAFRRQWDSRPLPEQYLAYDPRDPYDRRHYELFAVRSPTRGIKVPHGGHPVGAYLAETDMLQRLLHEVEAGTIDVDAFARELRLRRRRSGQYFFILAQGTPAHRPRQKIALAQLAAETQPDNPYYHNQLGAALEAVGQFDAAFEAHERALAIPIANMFQRHALMLHYEARGDFERALEITQQLIAENPAVLWLPAERKRIRRKRRRRTWIGRVAGKLGLDPLIERLFP